MKEFVNVFLRDAAASRQRKQAFYALDLYNVNSLIFDASATNTLTH